MYRDNVCVCERESEIEREVVASTVTAACGEEGAQEVVASVLPIVVTLLS